MSVIERLEVRVNFIEHKKSNSWCKDDAKGQMKAKENN